MSKYNPQYTGNPENAAPEDALNRAFICADAITSLLIDAFNDVEQGDTVPSNQVVSSALWAIDGFMREARELSSLIHLEAKQGAQQ